MRCRWRFGLKSSTFVPLAKASSESVGSELSGRGSGVFSPLRMSERSCQKSEENRCSPKVSFEKQTNSSFDHREKGTVPAIFQYQKLRSYIHVLILFE